jgi:hypothetical protein
VQAWRRASLKTDTQASGAEGHAQEALLTLVNELCRFLELLDHAMSVIWLQEVEGTHRGKNMQTTSRLTFPNIPCCRACSAACLRAATAMQVCVCVCVFVSRSVYLCLCVCTFVGLCMKVDVCAGVHACICVGVRVRLCVYFSCFI